MQELIISPYLLAAMFAVVSGVYSAVGLGGGSSYTALLAIVGAGYRVIPSVSLNLNILVTLVGSVNFARQGHFRGRLVIPLLLASMPMAYLGGMLEVSEQLFYGLLLVTLVGVAARIYLWEEPTLELELSSATQFVVAVALGAAIGLLSGMVGIGGGIYLIPIIVLLGLGDQKEAATAGAIFTGLNSVSGLTAHLQRHVPDPTVMAPLAAAVLVGSLIGSHLGSSTLSAKTVRKTMGVVILVAIALLIRRLVV